MHTSKRTNAALTNLRRAWGPLVGRLAAAAAGSAGSCPPLLPHRRVLALGGLFMFVSSSWSRQAKLIKGRGKIRPHAHSSMEIFSLSSSICTCESPDFLELCVSSDFSSVVSFASRACGMVWMRKRGSEYPSKLHVGDQQKSGQPPHLDRFKRLRHHGKRSVVLQRDQPAIKAVERNLQKLAHGRFAAGWAMLHPQRPTKTGSPMHFGLLTPRGRRAQRLKRARQARTPKTTYLSDAGAIFLSTGLQVAQLFASPA
jgi:hypothetical protein